MAKLRFNISHFDKKSKARLGKIHCRHGVIKTPAFVPVGSSASVKSLTPDEIRITKTNVFFVNTYHMIFRPGISVMKKLGGLHKFMNWKGPIMTDSGGFQAFSLAEHGPRGNLEYPLTPIVWPANGVRRSESKKSLQNSDKKKSLVSINEKGIKFKSVWDGKEIFLGPKESIRAQVKLGADLIMAFDECTFYPITKLRARIALERTHRWAEICLEEFGRVKNGNQNLYGIVQGSVFKDLRVSSAKFMAQLPFQGLAIGSVANSREPREKVFAVLDWTLPYLWQTYKPIHFLGIGEIEDIFLSIEKGIDSLDCVTPTRLGRMGWIFTKEAGLKNKFRYDISKSNFSLDKNPPDRKCTCPTCRNFSRAYLHHLFKNRELLSYRLATLHNLFFFGNLMEKIRESISEDKFVKLKYEWLR